MHNPSQKPTLNPKPLTPKTLNPKPLNPKLLNPKLLNPEAEWSRKLQLLRVFSSQEVPLQVTDGICALQRTELSGFRRRVVGVRVLGFRVFGSFLGFGVYGFFGV